jgi:hypothetical protein
MKRFWMTADESLLYRELFRDLCILSDAREQNKPLGIGRLLKVSGDTNSVEHFLHSSAATGLVMSHDMLRVLAQL